MRVAGVFYGVFGENKGVKKRTVVVRFFNE